jgi:hypothetical protein
MPDRKVRLLAAVALAAAVPAAAGVYFSAVTTVEGAPGVRPPSTTVRCWAQGDKARVEFVTGADPLLRPGRFLLTLDGGRSVYLVDPAGRTFSEWSGDAAMWTSSAAAARPSSALEKAGEDDGGELVGVRTRRLVFRAASAPAGAVAEEELWVAPELAEGALAVWMRRPAAETPDESAAAKADRERYGSFPLRRVATLAAGGRGGAPVRRLTTVVTELSVEELSAGTFAMGSGFREKPLSVLAAEAAREPQQEPAEDLGQESGQYPFDEMVQPEPEAQQPPQQPRAGQPGAVTGAPTAGARQPAPPPTPVPVAVPDEPQEDPVYPFERMLAPER